jgi:hypothetical protein
MKSRTAGVQGIDSGNVGHGQKLLSEIDARVLVYFFVHLEVQATSGLAVVEERWAQCAMRVPHDRMEGPENKGLVAGTFCVQCYAVGIGFEAFFGVAVSWVLRMEGPLEI